MHLQSIIDEVNFRSKTHPIGKLQQLRKDLKTLRRLPSPNIFPKSTTFERWAFHFGGRPELQFNIGIERRDGADELRHGVAFSFKTSRSLPDVTVLIPKVKLFNDFMQLYSENFSDMRMWYYCGRGHDRKRSLDYMPTSIPHELVTEKDPFVFLGKRKPAGQIDCETILNDFDRLLPLYTYIESAGRSEPITAAEIEPFEFRSGRYHKLSSTVASLAQKELDINLRHNRLQRALRHRLQKKYGAENVKWECPSGNGTSIDLVVHQKTEFWFYEIKTAISPRACIREAVGQLLEYSFWPGSQEAARLIVVGESPLDEKARAYLQTLVTRLSLAIDYEQISA
jgi:hypothetical protein